MPDQYYPVPTVSTLPFGSEVLADGRVRFRLWAQTQQQVSLKLEGRDPLPMQAVGDGWFSLVTDQAQAGDTYQYILADGQAVPDPLSRYQPADVFGPSQIIDPTVFQWTDAEWRGRPWAEAIIYELHVGTFTAEGNFRAAIGKLDHLRDLGVNTIELMPLADFPGARNWGYDGVLLFAPDSSYGTPDDLRALIDGAHARGLAVMLDVVYNHFGPEGNMFAAYDPQLFTPKHQTPWGNAVNYGDEGSGPVRDLIIANACYWIREFHFDGLRLDAVHAIIDESPKHILEELAEHVRGMVGDRKEVYLVIENDLNQPHFLQRNPDGRARWYDAQWNDDFHHCLHAVATQESFGYYCAYTECVPLTARSLAEGFAYQGEISPFTDKPRGEISAFLPPTAFVNFIQNHDQIGNRAFGERIGDISCSEGALRAITAIYLLSPEIPLLFMGEEWNAKQPFQFFCTFDGELGESIRKGRKDEFADFPAFSDPETREKIPDPTAPETMHNSKLDWTALAEAKHAEWLDWYRSLLMVRRDKLVPYLHAAPGGVAEYKVWSDRGIEVTWPLGEQRKLRLIANLGPEAADVLSKPQGDTIWLEGSNADNRLAPWTVHWLID